jgi:hypothetical protein
MRKDNTNRESAVSINQRSAVRAMVNIYSNNEIAARESESLYNDVM